MSNAELLLGGREAYASSHQPSVSWHAIPQLESTSMTAAQAMTPGKGRSVGDFHEWRRAFNPTKVPFDYEQVIHFPSFSSVETFMRTHAVPLLDAYKQHKLNLLANDRIDYRGGGEIAGTNRAKGVKGFAEMLLTGWEGGRERLAQEALDFQRAYQHEIATPTWHQELVGDEVDIPTFLDGDPEHMYGYQMAQKARKVINITVDTGVRCSACGGRAHDAAPTHPVELLTRGLMAAMMVQQLAKAGHAVTLRTVTHAEFPLHALSVSYMKPQHPHVRDDVKAIRGRMNELLGGVQHQDNAFMFMRTVVVDVVSPGDTVNMDNVMIALAHEGWARQFDFAVHEHYGLQQPFTPNDSPPIKQLASVGRYDRNHWWVVGQSPLSESWRDKLASSVDTQADIYLPPPYSPMDLVQGFDLNPNKFKAAVPRFRELFGENYALSGTLTGSESDEGGIKLDGIARQVYEMLLSVGVQFS